MKRLMKFLVVKVVKQAKICCAVHCTGVEACCNYLLQQASTGITCSAKL